jgi:hypothetical protein
MKVFDLFENLGPVDPDHKSVLDGRGFRVCIGARREDADFTLYRGRERDNQMPILAVAVAAEQLSPQSLRRLEHEYSLATELDAAWTVQPLALTRYNGRAALLLKDPGGERLNCSWAPPQAEGQGV